MLRVGIIGAGGMGNAHARQYRKMPDVDLTFHDRNPDKAKAYAERWDAKPWKSVEELIEQCDVVDVCLPTDLHVETGLRAISAGRAVVMEKPIARTLEEGARLVQGAQKAGVPLMPGQVVRFFPEFAEGNRLVRSGTIGTPAAARTRRGGLAPTGSDSWFMDHERSGGVLLDLAIHDFDWLRWTLGEVEHLYARSLGAKTGKGPDYGLTTLTFENGAIAHVESTWMDPSGFRVTFEVAGSDGLIEFDSRTRATLITSSTGESGPVIARESLLTPLEDPYYRQLRGFIDAVQAGTEPPVTGYDGWMALSIALSAVESAKTDKAVRPARGL
jgi:UDP-N-acetylglucosamine 3-dehydrogenase